MKLILTREVPKVGSAGDVVTVKDPKSGELQDYVNLVSDLIGVVGQNPLKDKIAWLKIRINRLNGTSNSQLL